DGGNGSQGGAGGSATSHLTYSHPGSALFSTSIAFAGAAGASESTNGRPGANALASTHLTAVSDIDSEAASYGGAGGAGINGGDAANLPSADGIPSAGRTAIASSTANNTTGDVAALAGAFGGAGIVDANHPLGGDGGDATATASATAGASALSLTTASDARGG